MPDTRITRERLKNHWVYSSWKYLLMVVIFVAGWNLTYSVTEYKPPREKRLEMYVLAQAYNDENVRALAAEMAPEFVGEEEGDMEALNFYTMSYGGSDDTYGPQLLMTRLASFEGDIYLVDEETMASFVSQELATPLDDYIASGALHVDGIDLEAGTRAEPAGEDEEGNTIYSSERHVYALPAQQLYGMLENELVDNRGMYFVVMSYSDKPDLCIELLNAFIDRFKEDKPDSAHRSGGAQAAGNRRSALRNDRRFSAQVSGNARSRPRPRRMNPTSPQTTRRPHRNSIH